MTILKMFVVKKNLVLNSILIFFILSFSSVCFCSEGNPIPLNRGILESYFNEWWLNCTASTKIERNTANYNFLKEKLDSSAGICFVQNGNTEQLAFLKSTDKLEMDSNYIKNIKYYSKSGSGIAEFTGTRWNMNNYSTAKYVTTANLYRYNVGSQIYWQANTQRGDYVTIIQNVDINWVFDDSINSNTPSSFEIATTLYTTYENAIFTLYKGDSLISGDVPTYIGDLTSTYGSGIYTIFADKNLFTESSDYLIYMTLSNDVVIKSDYAYIVVDSPSNGGNGSSGVIVVPSGDSGVITTISGDKVGSIDMTGVQNRLDGVNQNLGVLNQNIEELPNEIGSVFYNSGDSSGDNKGIVQKIYQDLFVVDDNFIKDKVDELGEEMGISGEYLKESTEMILSVYDENQKGDFVISWEPFYLEDVLFIPSGDVNFSKVERDVPAVQDLMFWVRLVLSFSCFSLIIRQIWFLILATLGVTTSIYEDYVEEENALIGQTYETISTSNVQDGVRTTISHRRKLRK